MSGRLRGAAQRRAVAVRGGQARDQEQAFFKVPQVYLDGMAQLQRLGVMLTVVCASASCGPQRATSRGPVAVIDATRGASPSDLVLTVSSCHGRPTASVSETASKISATVTATTTTGNAQACADGVVIHLKAPIGNRSFRDSSNGKTWALD